MHAVVGGVKHDGVVGNVELIELVQQVSDQFIVRHHNIVVEALARLAQVLLRRVRAEVHAGGVYPHEEWLVFLD